MQPLIIQANIQDVPLIVFFNIKLSNDHATMLDLEEEQTICVSAIALRGVRGQTVLFNLALRERSIQVRLYLKIVLKS